MDGLSVYITHVNTPDGPKDYVTLTPPEVSFRAGVIPESIVGILTRPLDANEDISPKVFARNSLFVKFMHDVIASDGPAQPELQKQAKQIGNGWVYIIDQRTKTPQGTVPPHDIIGAFEVKNGEVVLASYKANQNHAILSEDGFVKLGVGLQRSLLAKLEAKKQKSHERLITNQSTHIRNA